MKTQSQKLKNNKPGFSLLEVMVALVIMGMSLLAIFMAQTRSMRMAEKSRVLTVATELARMKLIDCKAKLSTTNFSQGNFSEHGDFSEEGHKGITWECFSYPFDMPQPDQESLSKAMKAQSDGNSNQLGGMNMAAGAMAPFFSLVSTTLENSIRELALVVRWKSGEFPEEMRVVTHIIDRTSLMLLTSQLPDQPMLPPGMQPPQRSAPR